MGIITNDVIIITLWWVIMTLSLITLSVTVAFRIAKGENEYANAWHVYREKMRNRFIRRHMFDPDFTKGYSMSEKYRFVTRYVFFLDPYKALPWRARRILGKVTFSKRWEISWTTIQRRPSKKTVMFRGMMRRLYGPMFDCFHSSGRPEWYLSFTVKMSDADFSNYIASSRSVKARAGRPYFVFPVVRK